MMNENKKFILAKEPYIRKADNKQNTNVMMRDFIVALIPLILFAWIKNGLLPFIEGDTNFLGLLYPLILVVVGGATSILFEMLWYAFIIKSDNVVKKLKNSFAVIPGLLLGMIVPLATPVWVLIFGVFFATVIGKLIFGGFGSNVFNPALVGYLFLTFAYAAVMNSELGAISAKGVFNGSEALTIISGSTPLTVFMGDRIGSVESLISQYGLLNMFLGFTPGALAETSALLCLISMVYLIVRKTIKWTIPVFYLGTVFVLTYIIGAVNGFSGLNYALFGLFNGGLMFGAVFMATEPVTSPRNPNGRIIYAVGMGVLTIVFRFASNSPEGVATSILIMNMFAPIIERVAGKIRVEKNTRKVALTYAVIVLLFAGISTFAVTSNLPEGKSVEIQYTRSYQDFENLNEFEYIFNIDGEEVVVITEQDYTIKTIGNETYNSDNFKAQFTYLINTNKLPSFITKIEETEDSLKLTVFANGYKGNFPVVITYDNDNKMIGFAPNTNSETYGHSPDWDGSTEPSKFVGDQILATPADLDNINIVSGATKTSKAIISAARTGNDYLEYLANFTALVLTGSSQNYEGLGFTYIFRNGTEKVVVKTDSSYVITSIGDDAIKAAVQSKINENKLVDYIKSVDTTGKKFVIITKGYGGNEPIQTTVTYDVNYKIVDVDIIYGETYEYSPTWDQVTHPDVVLPEQIVTNQDDLDKVEIVTGASVTSRSIKRAAVIAVNYLNNLKEASNE